MRRIAIVLAAVLAAAGCATALAQDTTSTSTAAATCPTAVLTLGAASADTDGAYAAYADLTASWPSGSGVTAWQLTEDNLTHAWQAVTGDSVTHAVAVTGFKTVTLRCGTTVGAAAATAFTQPPALVALVATVEAQQAELAALAARVAELETAATVERICVHREGRPNTLTYDGYAPWPRHDSPEQLLRTFVDRYHCEPGPDIWLSEHDYGWLYPSPAGAEPTGDH